MENNEITASYSGDMEYNGKTYHVEVKSYKEPFKKEIMGNKKWHVGIAVSMNGKEIGTRCLINPITNEQEMEAILQDIREKLLPTYETNG